MHPYFAYGSNLNREDMRTRCPDARADTTARLKGWRLIFRGVADIEPAAGETVYGALWSLSTEDIRRLDAYEGAPSSYRQTVVQVETKRGARRAMTYVMARSSYLGLPSPWYLGRIEAGFRVKAGLSRGSGRIIGGRPLSKELGENPHASPLSDASPKGYASDQAPTANRTSKKPPKGVVRSAMLHKGGRARVLSVGESAVRGVPDEREGSGAVGKVSGRSLRQRPRSL